MSWLRTNVALACCLVFPPWAFSTSGEISELFPSTALLSQIENRSKGDASPESIFQAHLILEEAYGVPICIEWPYVSQDRDATMEPKLVLELDSKKSLATAVSELTTVSEGRLIVDRIKGVFVVRPPNSDGAQENVLDTRISLSISGVSTWEAIKLIILETNLRGNPTRRLEVWPEFLSDGSAVVPGFAEGEDISLDIKNTTVREALCEIFHASQVALSYTYTNYYRPELFPSSAPISRLNLRFFKDGKPFRTDARMPRTELKRWMGEMEEISRSY